MYVVPTGHAARIVGTSYMSSSKNTVICCVCFRNDNKDDMYVVPTGHAARIVGTSYMSSNKNHDIL
jgi:hypothetical protein